MDKFSPEDAEQILVRATRRSQETVTREQLAQMAAEAGISETELQHAIDQHRHERDDAEILAAFRARSREKFWKEAVGCAYPFAISTGIWWFTGHGYFWPVWVLLACSIGLLERFSQTFLRSPASEQRALEKYKKQRSLTADSSELRDRLREQVEEPVNGVKVHIGIRSGKDTD